MPDTAGQREHLEKLNPMRASCGAHSSKDIPSVCGTYYPSELDLVSAAAFSSFSAVA